MHNPEKIFNSALKKVSLTEGERRLMRGALLDFMVERPAFNAAPRRIFHLNPAPLFAASGAAISDKVRR